MNATTRQELHSRVLDALRAAGWHDDSILADARLPLDPPMTVDFLLLHEAYPVAAVIVTDRIDSDDERCPFPLLRSDGARMRLTGPRPIDQNGAPGPEALWRATRGDWSPNTDPRLARCSVVLRQPYQVFALAGVLDALAAGEHQVAVHMAVQTGKSLVAVATVLKLVGAGRARRALVVTVLREEAERLGSEFQSAGSSSVSVLHGGSQPGRIDLGRTAVEVATCAFAVSPARDDAWAVAHDLVVFMDLTASETTSRLFARLEGVPLIGFLSFPASAPPGFERPAFSYDVEQLLRDRPTALMGPTIRLGDVAELFIGAPPLRGTASDEPRSLTRVPSLRGSDVVHGRITPAAGAEVDVLTDSLERGRLRAGDLLLPRIAHRDRLRIMAISTEPPVATVAGSTVIVVRPRGADSGWIAQQLARADVQRELSLISTTVSGALSVSIRALAELRLETPPPAGPSATAPAPPQSPLAQVATRVEAMLSDIRAMVDGGGADSGDQLAVVARTLRGIAAEIAPPSLEDTVLTAFPTPIARAFRRFYDSRFNVFERVLRLRDLGESVMYFVYNSVLADAVGRLRDRCVIRDKSVRTAYEQQSMAMRISFVDAMTQVFRDADSGLFLPELVRSSFVERARTLQRFRNQLSHSSVASESRSAALLEEMHPIVIALLNDVRFLADVRLVRMTGLHRERTRWVRRMELYQGVMPHLVEERLEDDDAPALADHKHLVLIDEDDEILDLHPLYQVVVSSQTNHEQHLCFFKHLKGGELHGESSETAIELTLPHLGDFVLMPPPSAK